MTRRETILNLTADLRQALRAAQIEYAEVDALRNDPTASHWRRVRASDRAFDLKGKMETLCRMIDAKINAFVAQEKAV